MSANAVLNAETRKNAGTGAARALRRAGKIPAILYSKGEQAIGLALPEKDLRLQYIKGRFRSRIIELKIDGKSVKALPRDVQFHPVTDKIEHVDFQKVTPGVTLHVFVPVKFIGMDKSPGIKRGGVLNAVRHEIEFICTPETIPHHIEVSVAELDIGGSVHINEVKLPAGITATIKRNFTVATVAGRSAQMEVEEEVKPAAEALTPEAAAAAAAAGAAPGAAAPAAGAAAPAAGAAAPAAAKKDEKK